MRFFRSGVLKAAAVASVVVVGIAGQATAGIVPFSTQLLNDYLVLAKSVDSEVTVTGGSENNRNTYGWVKALPGSAPAIPAGVPSPLTAGPTYNGDVALLDDSGTINFQDFNLYGDPDQGVVGKPTIASYTDSGGFLSNAGFDNNDGGGVANFMTNRGLEQFGTTTTQAMGPVADAVDAARIALMAMESMTADVNIATNSGKITGNTFVELTNPGVNIVKFTGAGSNDILVENGSLVFSAPDSATPGDRTAIVFVPDTSNFLTSNGNLLVDDDMGTSNVVLVTFKEDNNTHFGLSNTVINGVALWDLFRDIDSTADVPEISFDNVSGCTHIIGDKVAMSSQIHLGNCGFAGVIPEPGSLALLGLSGLALLVRRRHTT